jgi:chromate transporter
MTMQPTPPAVSFGLALRFWLKLGFISFGGPAGQIALMHEELVVRRRWISERRFLHALNYCMLLPGPEAQQLATYLGWLMHRTAGGLAAGVLFVLPSLFILVALSWVYVRFGQVPQVAAVFWGLKPAVVALVVHAAWRLGGRTLRHPLRVGIAVLSFALIAGPGLGFPWIVLGAALVGLAGTRWAPQAFAAAQSAASAPPAAAGNSPQPACIDDDTPTPAHARFSRARLVRVVLACLGLGLAAAAGLALAVGPQSAYLAMARFFTQAALVTFGGAYAVLPYVVQGAVEQHGWLSTAQMMDGLALGETTPGPLIMVVAFVGFLGGWQQALLGPEALLAAGVLGAGVATFFTFLPSFLFILAGGPLVEATRGRLGFTAPLTAISAAVVGVIASLGVFFAVHTVWPRGLGQAMDVPALVLATVVTLALVRWKLSAMTVLGACAAAGWVLQVPLAQ